MNQMPDDFCAAFGLFVEACRLDASMTKKDLARKAGIAGSTVGNIEKGEPCLMNTAHSIAQVFGYELQDFLSEAREVAIYTTPRL